MVDDMLSRMKCMFVAKPEGELTQVDFWNLYKDTFTEHAEKNGLLVASDVIKNVNHVFPQAQAMVLQGPIQKFVVRGVDRRKEATTIERFKCQWDRGQCPEAAFQASTELYDHLLEHHVTQGTESACLWAACPQKNLPKAQLRFHILTHLSTNHSLQKHPSQSDTITLPLGGGAYHPVADPTSRPVPPLRSTVINYTRPKTDPSSPALTTLLIIRILYRTSFASADAAPRADAEHFGFPGAVEDTSDLEDGSDELPGGDDKEGEMQGRKAFIGVRKLLENINIQDSVLMSWVEEMVDMGLTGSVLAASP